MSDQLERRLSLLDNTDHRHILTQIRRGIEKESLRVTPTGRLAQTPHPRAFGSALTHPQITTDFSEALLEFITPVSTSIARTLAEVDAIHRFVYSELQDEMLWPASMPCILGPDSEIPVARYGTSNVARMKTLYRVGLGHRYGRRMQTIAGIHYNFSAPDALWPLLHEQDGSAVDQCEYVTESYFGLIRNFRRHAWLLMYLFGAAPAVCGSFLNGQKHALQPLNKGTLHLPWGTSLRMGDLGYQSNAQRSMFVCYNSLDNYIETLKDAITTTHPDYEKFGADQQLSAGLLQIENEFYSPIRPKRVTRSGEIPLGALRRAGVEYIEVRCIDVNPMQSLGIDAEQIYFLDCFLVYCLLRDSPDCDMEGNEEINANLRLTVDRGREPGLELGRDGEPVSLQQWGLELLKPIADVAAVMDSAHGVDDYSRACRNMVERLQHGELTPSAQMLAAMRQGASYYELTMDYARQRAAEFRARPLEANCLADFRAAARESLQQQAEIEAADNLSFDDYLRAFYRQYEAL